MVSLISAPDSFAHTLQQFAQRGYAVLSHGWTSHLKRHYGATVMNDGQQYYLKMAIADQKDLDEPNMRAGFEREVWWSSVIQRLRAWRPNFPLTSPRVIEHNLDTGNEVVYVLLEFVEGKPIIDWDPATADRIMSPDEGQSFDLLLDLIVLSDRVLASIRPTTLEYAELTPLPPFLPHGSRGSLDRWQRKLPIPRRLKDALTIKLERRARRRISANPESYALGNGAFELENFLKSRDGRKFLLDNEFAGWYSLGDHISYLYHRLYCNSMRPDLARRLLERFARRIHDERERRSALRQIRRLLIPRVIGGAILDMSPRRKKKFWPWHRKQRLRMRLLLNLLLRRYGSLM